MVVMLMSLVRSYRDFFYRLNVSKIIIFTNAILGFEIGLSCRCRVILILNRIGEHVEHAVTVSTSLDLFTDVPFYTSFIVIFSPETICTQRLC
mmetsp:Transcript_6460/g.8502  ORF Transcript_6460/g.8502 Transcript_6460/m.8502 type:complete len:93 (-) Transcript_6460:306-584(-)